MIETVTEGTLSWVDVLEPTPEEIRELITQYKIPPELAHDWGGTVTRSTAIEQNKIAKLTLDFPIVKRTDINHPHEIKFIITKKALITIRYEETEAIHRFKKDFEVITTLHKTKKNTSGAHIFIALMHTCYDSLETKLDYVETRLSEIEAEIFKAREKEMVSDISAISRKLIQFRQTLKAHDDVFRQAKPIFEELYKKDIQSELFNIHNEYFHIIRRTTALFESLDELRNTNTALLTTKQNEIMKILTIMAFITFPLTLLTSMFGMNTKTTPIIGQDGDFWIIILMMSILTIAFFGYFKYKRWM